MDMKSKLRLALGTLRDRAAIGKAVIAGRDPVSADMEVAILRCTDRSDAPVDDRYVNELLFLVANTPRSAAALARKLTHRLETARDHVVSLKTLLLLHRLLRGGDRRFELDIRDLYLSRCLRLDLGRFAMEPGAAASFLRGYADFLDERMNWVINSAGKLELSRPPADEATALHRLSRCQIFLDRTMDCLPPAVVGTTTRPDRATQSALNIILRESFRVYASLRESLEAVMASSAGYDGKRRELARRAVKRAASQSLRLQSFYEDCKRIAVGKNLDYPHVKFITTNQVSAAEDLLRRRRPTPGCRGEPIPGGREPPPPSALSAGTGEEGREREQEDRTAGGKAPQMLFSCEMETRISTEWVAFEEEGDVDAFAAPWTTCSRGSSSDLLLPWESFEGC